MYHISEQGFRCLTSVSRGFRCFMPVSMGSDVSYQHAGVQMFHASEQRFRCTISVSRGSGDQ